MTEASTQSLNVLLERGVLGAFCVLLLAAVVVLFRALMKAKDAQLADQRSMTDVLQNHTKASADLTVETARSTAGMVAEVKGVLGAQERAIDTLRNELIQVRNAISQLPMQRR